MTSAGFVYGEVAGFSHSEGSWVSVPASTLEDDLGRPSPQNRTNYVRFLCGKMSRRGRGSEASFTTRDQSDFSSTGHPDGSCRLNARASVPYW